MTFFYKKVYNKFRYFEDMLSKKNYTFKIIYIMY